MRFKSRMQQALLAASVLLGLLLPAIAFAVNEPWPVPAWAVSAFEAADIEVVYSAKARYIVTFHINPTVSFGDFDGDHRTDVAVLIRDPKSGKVGIAVARQAGGIDVIGAGVEFGNGGDDFRWLDHWYTYTQGTVQQGASDDAPPTLAGDALYVEKSESASAIVYFTGKAFAWYQQGD